MTTMRRPEYHRGVSSGTTCADPTFDVITLFPPAASPEYQGELEVIRKHCERSAKSSASDVREKGEEGLALLAQLAAGGPAAAYTLGRWWQEWRDKDATEKAFLLGHKVGNAKIHGSRGGAPAKKRAAAERWLREHEDEVRRRLGGGRQTREGLAAWALMDMMTRKVRPRPSLTTMKAAVRSFLK